MWSKDIRLLSDFTIDIAKDFFKKHGVLSNQNSRGYKFFLEGYLHDLWFQEHDLVLKAKSYHSQKKNQKPHTLSMCFKTEPTLTVVECHCSCEVGLSQSCHHLIGLAFYLQDLVLRGEQQLLEPTASTSMPMKWNIPRGTKVMPENVTNVSFGKPSKLTRKKNPISYKLLRPKTTIKSLCSMSKQERLTKFTNTLKKLDETIPLSYLIDPNDTDESMTVLALQTKTQALARDVVDDKLPVELPILNLATTNILISLPLPDVDRFLQFTMDDAKTLEAKTRLQGISKEWHQSRKFIFTSSNFGMLCKRTKAFGRDFFDDLWVEKDLGHVRSLEHGRKEEKNARDLYEKTTRNKCYCCGLIIHPYAPYLGTSPDGIVVTQSDIGLVEFKCPYGSKSGTLKEALKQKNFHLKENDNELVPNKKHNYYYQVQGQMLITGLKWCDLCTYFKKNNEICVVRVPFDEAFCYEMFDKLTEMYNVYLSL